MPDWRSAYRHLHFYGGNCWRLATIPWRQRTIAPAKATTIFGCSFGEQGWHHIRKTLEEYDADPTIPYTATTLYGYLKGFRPGGICDVMNLPCNLPLFVYPWGTFRTGETETAKNPEQSRFCGPSSDAFIADEFERIKRLYLQLRVTGYRPWEFGNTFIGGTFLVSSDGECRFVVLQGNHRMAIFAHLDYASIQVRDVPGFIPRLEEKSLMSWPLVASGRCDPGVAAQVFHSFFRQDGHHVGARLAAEASLACAATNGRARATPA